MLCWPFGSVEEPPASKGKALPPASLSNGTNTKAAGQAVGAGQQLPSARAFLLVLLGFPVYMEGSTSLLHFHPQSCRAVRWYSRLVGMEGKNQNREGIVQTGGCGGIIDLSQRGQYIALASPHPYTKCVIPPQLQAP